MVRSCFVHRNFTLEYARFGDGPVGVVAFHGFGREAGDFKGFESVFDEHLTLVAVNLFAHGQSRIPAKRPVTDSITKDEFCDLFEAFLVHLEAPKVVLMGYSMGARIALCCVEWMPDRVTNIVLMAPDGLKAGHLANFSTGTGIGRAIHRSVIKWPGLLLKSAAALRRLRLIDKKMHRFVHVHMGTEHSRRQVYAVWHIYRFFKPDLHALASIINSRKLPLKMIFGRFDSVIQPKYGRRFAALLDGPTALVIIESGHQLMHDALTYLKHQAAAPLNPTRDKGGV